MILVCPSCDTRYFAEDSSIGKEGRGACVAPRAAMPGTQNWPEEGETAARPGRHRPHPRTGRTSPPDRAGQLQGTRRSPRRISAPASMPSANAPRARAVGIAWGATAILFVAADRRLRAVPQRSRAGLPESAASIYRLVGLDVNRYGLTLENVVAKRSFDGTTPVLTVTGSAVNKFPTSLARPLRTPRHPQGRGRQGGPDLDRQTGSSLNLKPGERTEFTSKFEAPPVETYRLTVTFAYPDGEAWMARQPRLKQHASQVRQPPAAHAPAMPPRRLKAAPLRP